MVMFFFFCLDIVFFFAAYLARLRLATDDVSWIASMSKPVTSVYIAILADDGKLGLDDPLAKHLPEFSRRDGRPRRRDRQASPPGHLAGRDFASSGLGEMTAREPHLTLARPASGWRGSRCAFNRERAGLTRRRVWTCWGAWWKW